MASSTAIAMSDDDNFDLQELIAYAESLVPIRQRHQLGAEMRSVYADLPKALNEYVHWSTLTEASPQFLRSMVERIIPALGMQDGMSWSRESTEPRGSHYNKLMIGEHLNVTAARVDRKTFRAKVNKYRRMLAAMNPLWMATIPKPITGLRLSAFLEHLPSPKNSDEPKIFRLAFYVPEMTDIFHEIDLLPYFGVLGGQVPQNPAMPPEIVEDIEIMPIEDADAE